MQFYRQSNCCRTPFSSKMAFTAFWLGVHSICRLQAWVSARQAKDFSKFAPILKEWIDLIRVRCKWIDASRSCYDVALQDFEKGMSTARLDEIFSEVRILVEAKEIPNKEKCGQKFSTDQQCQAHI